MKDKGIIFSAAAIISFLFIVYVTVTRFNIKNLTSEFSMDAYYIPEYVDKSDDELQQIQNFLGKSSTTGCPVITPEPTRHGKIDISAFDTYYKKAYWFLASGEITNTNTNEDFYIFTSEYNVKVGDKDVTRWLVNKDWDKIHTDELDYYPINKIMKISPFASSNEDKYYPFFSVKNESNKKRVDENNKSDVKTVYQIIAPFAYKFVESTNLDRNPGSSNNYKTDIIIQSMDDQQRIKFGNVINWYCAGEPSTDNLENWRKHFKNHKTIIGDSRNATIKGGSAGTVIGYWEPKFKQETKDDGGKLAGEPWVEISVRKGDEWEKVNILFWLFSKKKLGSEENDTEFDELKEIFKIK